jgi:hypothetical protein
MISVGELNCSCVKRIRKEDDTNTKNRTMSEICMHILEHGTGFQSQSVSIKQGESNNK